MNYTGEFCYHWLCVAACCKKLHFTQYSVLCTQYDFRENFCMVKPVATVHVVPNLPEPLTRLRELAFNLRWSWDHDTIGLFRRLDRDLWETTGHNPTWMLGLIDQRRLEALCDDPAFMAQ